MFQLRPWARIQTPGLRFRLRILVPNAHDENFQQKKPNAEVWSGLLIQRQRLVCCERYVQNITDFIANKPVKS